MKFPYYQYPWYASSRPCYGKGIPVQSSPVQSSKPKKVSIPVHFAGSERNRSDSAVKIQKVIKGFLVRKNVKKIKAIMEQVNEIERNVSKAETVDLIRNNSKERLKLNETLMSLLFKLDSVSGLDTCVRDLRKTVIKKAIALQELVDAIACSRAEVVDESHGIVETCDQTIQSENYDGTTNKACDQTIQSENYDGTTSNACDQTIQSENYDGATNNDCDQTIQPEGNNEETTNHKDAVEAEADNEKERKLEKMIEDNEKMMGMMETLFERNEMQTRLMSALTRRVEQLEKAFLSDKLRRKKRRNSDDKSQDSKRFGGRREISKGTRLPF